MWYNHSAMSDCDDAYDGFDDFLTDFSCYAYSSPSYSAYGEDAENRLEYDHRLSELWQFEWYGDPPTPYEHDNFLIHAKSVNLINFLKSREINERISKSRKASTLLSFCLITRWSAVPRIEMLLDAKFLLGRQIYRWEGGVLTFLQSYAIEKSESKERNDALPLLLNGNEGFTPISLIDIVDVVLKNEESLTVRNDQGDDLLVYFFKEHGIEENYLEFVDYVIGRGYDTKRSGEELIRALCDSFRVSASNSEAKFKIMKMLFDEGLKLSDSAKRELLPLFTADILEKANKTSVKILNLLLEHGCQADDALINMGSGARHDWHRARDQDHLESLIKIVNILLDNRAKVNPPPDDPLNDEGCFLFAILEILLFQDYQPSLLQTLKSCLARGLDIHVTEYSQQNLLMKFCLYYGNDDLPEVIRYLCSCGIDVHALDDSGGDTLSYLSRNNSANSEVIYETVCLLVHQLKFDIKRTSATHLPSTLSNFFSKLRRTRTNCCWYGTLTGISESNCYWSILDLLLEGGAELMQQEKRVPRMALSYIFKILWREISGQDTICKDCLRTEKVSEHEALSTLGTVYFEKVFKLIERLVQNAVLKKTVVPYSDVLFRDPLIVACRCFRGEQLVKLVKLLCENGVNVNASICWRDYDTSEEMTLDAIGVLQHFNKDQAYLIGRLIEILKPYGYKPYGL